MILLGLFGTLGFSELMIILVIVVFLFGAKRIPEIARGLGQGIRGFRTAVRGNDREEDDADRKDEPEGKGR